MILVTGGTGFVGRSLLRALAVRGLEARPYDGQLNAPYSLRQQLQGVETVIHLASAERNGRVRRLHQVDVEGSTRLLEEAERANINHFIYLSHLAADPNTYYPAFRAKGQVEQRLRDSQLPTTILRSATLFGRDDHFLHTIASLAYWSWPFVWLPDAGSALFQPLWVEDLVRCLVAISDPLDLQGYRGQTLTAAGGERLHYREIVAQVLETSGMSRWPLPIRVPLVRVATRLLFSWHYRPPITSFFIDKLAVPEIADLDIVPRTFGFRPSRLSQHLTTLRQPGLARRVFR